MRLEATNKFRRLDSASEAGGYKLGWRLLVREGDTSKAGSNK